jgi:hypothetical protein
MDQPCKAAMAARIGLGHLLDNFEDSQRSSSLSPRFHRVPMDGWMWRPTAAEAFYRETPETGQAGVTTPPEIIQYYRLNHSIWSLSDNKESSH